MPLEAGMAAGFFTVAVGIGVAVDAVIDNQATLDAVKYLGAAFMLYLAYHIAKAPPMAEGEGDNRVEEKPLGPVTGFLLQFVNPKSWVYFVLLMTEYASRVGEGFEIIVLLAATTTAVGIGSVLFWSGAGAMLRRIFSDPTSAARLNLALGSLVAIVAIDIAFHDQIVGLIG